MPLWPNVQQFNDMKLYLYILLGERSRKLFRITVAFAVILTSFAIFANRVSGPRDCNYTFKGCNVFK